MTDLQAILDKGGPWQQARIIGDQLLINGDCLEVMAVLPRVCAVLTDPPYGIRYDVQAALSSGKKSGRGFGFKGDYRATDWDSQPAHKAVGEAVAKAKSAIVFGGNYYQLPASSCWLVWDKETNGSFADCELAWTNLDQPVRRIRHMWNGGIRKGHEPRHGHPTQKPIALMEWCLGFLPDARTILDPFAGSGTTAVACQRLGRQGIGIELDPDYFEIACRRVQEVVNNPPLFTPAPPKPTQDAMDI